MHWQGSLIHMEDGNLFLSLLVTSHPSLGMSRMAHCTRSQLLPVLLAAVVCSPLSEPCPGTLLLQVRTAQQPTQWATTMCSTARVWPWHAGCKSRWDNTWSWQTSKLFMCTVYRQNDYLGWFLQIVVESKSFMTGTFIIMSSLSHHMNLWNIDRACYEKKKE